MSKGERLVVAGGPGYSAPPMRRVESHHWSRSTTWQASVRPPASWRGQLRAAQAPHGGRRPSSARSRREEPSATARKREAPSPRSHPASDVRKRNRRRQRQRAVGAAVGKRAGMHNGAIAASAQEARTAPQDDKQPGGGEQTHRATAAEYPRRPARCKSCALRRPREGEKARERGKQEKTTGGRGRTAGVEFPRAVSGDPLTSSPASAAPHSEFERDTRAGPRSAQAGCSGAGPAGQPCPCPAMHGSIRRPRAGP